MCVKLCLFSALSQGVGTLQISIIIIIVIIILVSVTLTHFQVCKRMQQVGKLYDLSKLNNC